jgi:hypothetical protein
MCTSLAGCGLEAAVVAGGLFFVGGGGLVDLGMAPEVRIWERTRSAPRADFGLVMGFDLGGVVVGNAGGGVEEAEGVMVEGRMVRPSQIVMWKWP